MRLTTAYKLILQAPEIKAAIAAKEQVGLPTVRRWVRDESDMLTKASVVKVIKDMTGLVDSQILEDGESHPKVDTVLQ